MRQYTLDPNSPPRPSVFVVDGDVLTSWREVSDHWPILRYPFKAVASDAGERFTDRYPLPATIDACKAPHTAPPRKYVYDLLAHPPEWFATVLTHAALIALAWRYGRATADDVVEDCLRVIIEPAWAEIETHPEFRTVQGKRLADRLHAVAPAALDHLNTLLEPHMAELRYSPQRLSVHHLTVNPDASTEPFDGEQRHGLLIGNPAVRDSGWVEGKPRAHVGAVLLAYDHGRATAVWELDLARDGRDNGTQDWGREQRTDIELAAMSATAWLNTLRCPTGYRFDWTPSGELVLRTYDETADDAAEVVSG